jgi:hypothetical protein
VDVACAVGLTAGFITHEFKDGWTILHSASLRGHSQVVELLLAAGADPNAAEEVCWSSQSYRAYLPMDVA